MSKKLMPTFADRACCVVSATDPHGRIIFFLLILLQLVDYLESMTGYFGNIYFKFSVVCVLMCHICWSLTLQSTVLSTAVQCTVQL
jgi:hypothetical protein